MQDRGNNGIKPTMNDKYLFRRAESSDDAQKLHELFTKVFYPEDVGTLAVTLFNSLPRMKKKYWFIAEEKETATVVSAFALIPWSWEMDGIRFKVAEMGLVGTLENHRGRGLMKKMNREYDRTLEKEKFDLAVIQGIPGFYNRFGYHYAIPLENHINLPLHVIPEGPAKCDYAIRPAGLDDIDFLMREDNAYRNAYYVSAFRDEANWRYLLTESAKTEYGSEYWIIEHAGNNEKYYCRMPHEGFGAGLIISEVSECISYAATIGLLTFFKNKALERNKPYIRLNLHNESTAGKIALNLGAEKGRPYAWQIKIPDRVNLLKKIAPILEKRLQGSCFNKFSETLRLDFFKTKIDLVWQNGLLKSVLPGSEEDCPNTFCVSDDLFAPLCLGHRTWQALQTNRPDIFPAPQYIRPNLEPDQSGLLMDILFPARRSWVVERIRIDCVSEANHDLILWLDKPDTWGPVLI